MCKAPERFAKHERGLNSGLQDFATILKGITAIHAAARQIDQYVGAIKVFDPGAESVSIPPCGAPRQRFCVIGCFGGAWGTRLAREDHNVVAHGGQMAGEKGAKAPEVDPITPAKGELDHPGAIKPAKPSPEKKEWVWRSKL